MGTTAISNRLSCVFFQNCWPPYKCWTFLSGLVKNYSCNILQHPISFCISRKLNICQLAILDVHFNSSFVYWLIEWMGSTRCKTTGAYHPSQRKFVWWPQIRVHCWNSSINGRNYWGCGPIGIEMCVCVCVCFNDDWVVTLVG